MFSSIGKLIVRVAVDAMIIDLYHQFERAVVRRFKSRRSADG
jgi:hypothetical protein